jgi:4-hydroxyphenylpyruvate dioxygenase-like putative hemolysin
MIVMSVTTTVQTASDVNVDFLPLQGTDYVEFYVGNAKQAAHYYMNAFGFQALAYAGPETGVKDRASYAIRQHKLTFVLTTPIRGNNEIADHIYKHGDGVKFLALNVAQNPIRNLRHCRIKMAKPSSAGFIHMAIPFIFLLKGKITRAPFCQVSANGKIHGLHPLIPVWNT